MLETVQDRNEIAKMKLFITDVHMRHSHREKLRTLSSAHTFI